MTTTLTRRQRAIYEFVVDCVRSHGIPPSLNEIAAAFELASASGVADHLRAIERKGYIRRRPGVSRGIELVDARRRRADNGAVRVPVVGSLPAVRRLRPREEGRRHLLFDGRVARRGAIAVRVDLAGLEGHGILPGDYLIVVQGARTSAGQMALAHLGRTTALVEVLPGRRRVRRLDEGKELADSFELLGRVVAVLREMNGATRKSRR
jgi:repressor LexA